MTLINTIEINPYDFAKNEYESPKVSLKENPDAWHTFWLKSIIDSGLQNLKTIQKGSYLVDVNSINEAEWEIILQQHLKEVEWDFFEEQIGKLSGGIILKENDVLHVIPQCCGDIGMLKDWENILKNANQNWTQLWIGHPWIYYRRNNKFIEFSDYTELTLENNKDIKPSFFVCGTVLQQQLSIMRKEQNKLEFTIRKILARMNIPHPKTIAKLMTGNE